MAATARHVAAHAATDRAAIETPSPLPARAWRASEPVDDTPGARYVTRRGAWPAGERFPASVRWLPAESARRVGVRPQLPIGSYVDSVSQADQAAMTRLINGLDAFLTKPLDRALFDLPPATE